MRKQYMKYFIFLAVLIGFSVSATNDKEARVIKVESRPLTLDKAKTNKLGHTQEIQSPTIFSASVEVDSSGQLIHQCEEKHNHQLSHRENK